MGIIESKLNVQSSQFRENSEQLIKLIDQFREIEQRVHQQEELSRDKFEKRNKLLPRERVQLAIDPGSSFLEISSLAGYKLHDDKDGRLAGGGIIGGIGWISGVQCLIVANNSAIKGGTISPTGLEKILRLQEISLQNKLPLVTFAESGGANLNYAAEVYVPGARAFANQARLSAAGIPQITIVHGNATAGGAYQPGLSDYIVLIDKKSQMFLAGPPLVKAATGEEASADELGGSQVHAEVTGTGEYLAENDSHAISILRDIVGGLSSARKSAPADGFVPPVYQDHEILGVIPTDNKMPYDCREIIARITDQSEFLEFKADYEQQTICGHAKIFGFRCGIIGNNGPITAKGAGKAAQFIELCDQSETALIFLHNTTGFMVGTEAESSAIIKQGSKMIQAVANSRSSKISILIGGSYGAGNYAMCGRGFDPHFIFSWPNSRTAVMGGEQAGKVLRIISEEKAKFKGEPVDEEALAKLENQTAEKLNQSSTALFGTSRLWDDGIIDPRDTRPLLGFLLELRDEAEKKQCKDNRFGLSRH